MSAWDRREGESKKAYQAFCDYRDMGTSRSLRSLHEQYIEPSFNNPVTKSRSSLNTWSAQHDWQNRVIAWDNHLSSANTQNREDAVNQLIEDELRDYKLQLEKWTAAFNRMPLQDVVQTVEDGQTMIVINKVNHDDLYRMAKWRDEIAKQGRRALWLPDKVIERNVNIRTWEDEAIDLIKNGEIGYVELAEEFDSGLATELFKRAGVEITES